MFVLCLLSPGRGDGPGCRHPVCVGIPCGVRSFGLKKKDGKTETTVGVGGKDGKRCKVEVVVSGRNLNEKKS